MIFLIPMLHCSYGVLGGIWPHVIPLPWKRIHVSFKSGWVQFLDLIQIQSSFTLILVCLFVILDFRRVQAYFYLYIQYSSSSV